MKKMILLSATAALLFTACDTSKSGDYQTSIDTDKDKFSYAVGSDIGLSLEDFKDEINLDALFQAIADKVNGEESKVTAEEATAVKTEIFKKLREKAEADKKVKAESNIEEGKTFLETNKVKDGITTTESGLQYRVITKGEGEVPTSDSKVKVHYKGTLIDGTVFDSSYKRGNPATFRVGGVIKGWSEALLLMNVGSKYELVIPADLAYGERGAGKDIAPNSTLIFEVELISIEK
jgi:FKBP-type peptidyl-prolyl cis-trans isomerase